ncbi:hypothetical protein M9979_05040 [Sphingomonas sp. RP10(2022)]|uniref:Uncharacterized protein n=1 Tax=Sphingomonas liriopis TaxID=2949094 RepID=A0A9X2HTS8_9SPHN|nr:hypothetical protein [Sphingomonas liriopis]MCP3734241.1 hypothetical protein [Sphingomonas liriopis]
MTDGATARPRTVRLTTLALIAGAALALVVAWFGYRIWSERTRIAANKVLVASVFVQKRQFAPGELVEQSAFGTKVRVLGCTAGSDGMQDKCMVADEGDARPGEAIRPYALSAALLSIHENEYRAARKLPFLSGRRSDADLAPMLATWTAASRAAAETAPAATADAAPTMTAVAVQARATVPATTVPPPPRAAAARGGGGALPDGEYACYGSGMTVLAGLGFKTSGGTYTDLDGRERGTVTVRGTDVIFTGGHLGGQIGRDLKGKGFRIGAMATCEKW